MRYFMKLFWVDTIHLPSNVEQECILRTDIHFNEFKDMKTAIENFKRLTYNAQRLYDEGKPNQYYRVELYEESKDGAVAIKKWNLRQ